MAKYPSLYSRATRALAAFLAGFFLVTALAPVGVSAERVAPPGGGGGSGSSACSKNQFQFFGLEPWYQYLPYAKDPVTGRCEINESGSEGNVLGKGSFLILIVLAVIDDLLRVAGIVAVIFIIAGGFKFITSAGEPEAAASGRKTIMFALVGLVIALIAVVIVSFIGNSIGGG